MKTGNPNCPVCGKDYFTTTRHIRLRDPVTRSLCGAYLGEKDEKYVDDPNETSCESCARAFNNHNPHRRKPVHEWKRLK